MLTQRENLAVILLFSFLLTNALKERERERERGGGERGGREYSERLSKIDRNATFAIQGTRSVTSDLESLDQSGEARGSKTSGILLVSIIFRIWFRMRHEWAVALTVFFLHR